jgi:RNA polymerase sigma factor (sigma-70 family)
MGSVAGANSDSKFKTMNAAIAQERVFTTTRWSVVMNASRPESEHMDEALETLCRGYWYPVYVFLRRSGWTAHDAEDLTQAFFARVLEKNYLRGVDRSKGKFRSLLLAMLRHFLANHRRDAKAQKRGGNFRFLWLEDESIDESELRQVTNHTPEQSFDRQWAITLLDNVMALLRQEYGEAGKSRLFAELKVFLTGDNGGAKYDQLAARLGMTEAAVKMSVSRLRRRYAELLRAEVARTVSEPEDVEHELRSLFTALS